MLHTVQSRNEPSEGLDSRVESSSTMLIYGFAVETERYPKFLFKYHS